MRTSTFWIGSLILVAIISLASNLVRWGTLTIQPNATISVTGSAEKQESNQVAQFYAGMSAVNDDKQTAIDEVNQQMEAAIERVKEFGIPAEDIKTQNLSVYQDQESVTIDGRQRTQPGQWRANNSIQIKLRNVDQTSDLMAVLTESGLTDISGPNFTLDDSKESEAELINLAVDNAQDKAAQVAAAQGKTLGEVLSISEGGVASSPMYASRMFEGYGGGAPVEPGTSTVRASVNVIFELK